MKKRLLALLLALSMTAALAACDGKKETSAEEPEQVEDTVPETEETGAEEEPEDSGEAAEQPTTLLSQASEVLSEEESHKGIDGQ